MTVVTSQGLFLQRVREMILNGTLPPGTRVTEAGVALLLNSSRTPVRQALPALAKEGLLEPSGSRGYAVRAFTSEESFDALRIRATLEGLAARSIAEAGAGPELLARFDTCLAEGDAIFAGRVLTDHDETRYGTMNARFHQLLLTGSDIPLLAELVRRCTVIAFVAPGTIAFAHTSLQTAYDTLSYAHRQHHAIVDAIRARDAGRAEFLLREHAVTQEHSMNFVSRTKARPSSGRTSAAGR